MRSFVICTAQQIGIIMDKTRLRWAGHVARMGEKRNAYSVLMG
jgi:hypothetical protein